MKVMPEMGSVPEGWWLEEALSRGERAGGWCSPSLPSAQLIGCSWKPTTNTPSTSLAAQPHGSSSLCTHLPNQSAQPINDETFLTGRWRFPPNFPSDLSPTGKVPVGGSSRCSFSTGGSAPSSAPLCTLPQLPYRPSSATIAA